MSPVLDALPSATERRVWVYYLALVLALATFCFGDLRFHQLNTHDADSFADHLSIEQDGRYFFSSDKAQAQGRLFADAVKYAAFLVFGNDPASFHVLVVAAHVLASLLLAMLVRRMGFSVEWAFVSGLFFLLNVSHFEAVHWISALDYPLGLACACAALLCLETQTRGRLVYFSLLMVLAVQSHPSLATLWLLPLYRLWRVAAGRATFYRFAATAVPIAAAVAVVVFFASDQASTWQAVDEYAVQSISTLILGQVRIFLFLTSRLLSTAHWLPLPIYSQAPWELGLGLGVLGTLLYLAYRRQAPYDWAALWVLAGLFPYVLLTAVTIDSLPAGPSRYLYVASAGSSSLLAAGWQYIYRRQRHLGMALLLVVVVSSCINLRKVEAISHYTSARSYSARLEVEAALDQYERSLARAADVLPLEEVYPRYIIMLMRSERDFRPILAAARVQFPDNPHLRICDLAQKACSRDETERAEAMREIVRESLTLNYARNLSTRVLNNMGAVFLHEGDESRAIIAFEQALTLEPQRANILKLLGLAYMRRAAKMEQESSQHEIEDQLQRAVHAYRKSLELDPAPAANTFYLLGRVYERSGQLDAAQVAYRACLVREPGHELSWHRVARIYEMRDQRSEAIAAWENLLALTADPDAYLALGNLYFKSGALERAAQAYGEALRLEPHSMETLANLGKSFKQLGRLNEAHLAYRRALELAPDNPYLYYSLGEVEISLGNDDAAIGVISRALELGIEHEAAYEQLIGLLRAAGREQEAGAWEARRAASAATASP